jgi:sacsin
LPLVGDIIFLDASISATAKLLKCLGYRPKKTRYLIEQIIIPNLHKQPPWLLDSLMKLVFDHWHSIDLNDSLREYLASVPFISVKSKSGAYTFTRLRPSEVIIEGSPLAQLYFDDEEVFGYGIYGIEAGYQGHLKSLGVKYKLDDKIVEDRILEYSELPEDDLLFEKCHLLIEMMNTRDSCPLKPELIDHLRLPALKDEKASLLLVSECRPERMRPLVDGVLGIVPDDMYIKPFLQKAFGWNALLPPSLLASRIDKIATIGCSEVESALFAILQYINSHLQSTPDQIGPYISSILAGISVDKWFPSSSEGLCKPAQIFFNDVQQFEPYVSRVPRGRLMKYKDLLHAFGVQDFPTVSSLLDVLGTFPLHELVTNADLDVIINVLESLSKCDDVWHTELRLPGTDGRLYRIEEFQVSGGMTLYAHFRVPESFVFKYGVPQADRDLAFIELLNTTDIFDEYCLEEQITTRISNTLKDYSLSTTFNEFIANAEDCGTASQVSWYLDSEDTKYPTEHLFCSELKQWQTRSLFVYNDGVFSKSDFEAFINIGAGTKASDSTKIGKYGLGSLTMYHFTDVPSMISGEYFVILDPSRRYLPLHGKKRRAGLRIPLSLMAREYLHHLVPFVGIGGYALGTSPFYG